jgi:hypothetical protein
MSLRRVLLATAVAAFASFGLAAPPAQAGTADCTGLPCAVACSVLALVFPECPID